MDPYLSGEALLRHAGSGSNGLGPSWLRKALEGSDALALTAWGGFMRAAQALRSAGSFAGLAEMAPFSDVNEFFAADLRWRLKTNLAR